MYKDIRLHGQVGGHVEYFVMVVGNEAYQRYFFNIVQDEEHLRIFSPGNEFIISPEGIGYQGNGGYFCEYMFGVDQPSSDLAKPDIINRLVMYGARSHDTGSIRFSDRTQGEESFENIFFEGNAVCNYYFFVHSNQLSRKLRYQQEELVKNLGKIIKRSESVGDERDDALISNIFPLLRDDSAQLFIIKLINRHHREYRDLFKSLYYRNKKIADDDFARLVKLAATYQIDRYQQERMRIDAMYRHPSNKRIVDEYRNILLACNTKGEISHLDNARLTRLKTLSVRNKIPGALFYTLDEMLKRGRNLVHHEEQDYIAATREVLQGIFLREKEIESPINREDMLNLIQAKKRAVENRDHSFDQLMLDASKECDEKIRDGADPGLMDGFSYVITYLDRFDSVSNLISQLAFMENVRVNEEMLQGLLEHKAAFDNLREGCFEELFIHELFHNAYLGRFGRRKVTALLAGLRAVEKRTGTTEELHRHLQKIDQEERISSVLLEHVRDRIRNFYSRFTTRADQEALRREVIEELKNKRLIKADIPGHIFHETIFTIKKEAMYLHSLLPQIIAERNVGLREDFLENSGLDRFYVEELEREYYEKNGLDLEGLYQIRKGLS
ncbi:TIGR04442 family protein [Oryzomonas sagensis]|uniref:TIGR04442 family protein n=1 Tax=Oryzomonas sagensis TaxID=2603857 RepID=A0ABQ6TRQ6_9BACT|nr:TIGR04442 family protein [Oryzomonas sagensis]KAB0671674.1 TIGR04442 family protein [Oryzomonas sagensis]